jgi:hypothetical protein
MGAPIKYGKVTTAQVISATVLATTEEKIYESQPIDKVITLTESLYVKTDNDAIGIFLAMHDDMKAGKIDNIGVQCIRHRGNGKLRVEKTWTVKHLP